ncbi:hypothetical protein ZWY2020_001675 [Hordeum vulgare]|nr:hypothetical protein ZWY2020_001675 [Hordeum vulgare]
MNSGNNPCPNPNPIPKPFPWGSGWRALFLGCSLADRPKFENTTEVCSYFKSMEELHKEAGAVVKKATTEELKILIPDPMKGALLVDILRWAMNQADSDDSGQRVSWAKYRHYRHPLDHRAAVYFTTSTMGVPLEEDQEPVHMKMGEDVVDLIVRAPVPGHRSLIIELDSREQEEMEKTKIKTKAKAKATSLSNRLWGPRGKIRAYFVI